MTPEHSTAGLGLLWPLFLQAPSTNTSTGLFGRLIFEFAVCLLRFCVSTLTVRLNASVMPQLFNVQCLSANNFYFSFRNFINDSSFYLQQSLFPPWNKNIQFQIYFSFHDLKKQPYCYLLPCCNRRCYNI